MLETGSLTGLKSHTSEDHARIGKQIDALVSLFPMEHCRDLVMLTIDEIRAKILIEDRMQSLLTPKQDAEQLSANVITAAEEIVRSWLGVLYYAQHEAGNKLVRLDSSLLPPPELKKYDGVGWDESLAGSLALTAERIRELMFIYASQTVVFVFKLMIANHPNGFKLTEDVFICMDADGFYLPPKAND